MRYKRFGKTDWEVSIITAGTIHMGQGDWTEERKNQTIRALHCMMDLGVNFIDTAPTYGRTVSEQTVGEAIKGKDRSKFYLSTKYGNNRMAEGIRDHSRKTILFQIDDSLKRMGTDYIDLYIQHWPQMPGQPEDTKTPYDETMAVIEELKKAGKIRAFAVSNHSIDEMEGLMEHGSIEAIQPFHNLLGREWEPIMSWCDQRDIASMSYGSMNGGMLAGAYREYPAHIADTDIRVRLYRCFRQPLYDASREVFKVIDGIAKERNVPVSQIAINWATQQKIVHTAIIGSGSMEHARENCGAGDWELTAEELARLTKAAEEHIGPVKQGINVGPRPGYEAKDLAEQMQ